MQLRPEQTVARSPVDDARPATFLERGVMVPFTTPMLLGSRVRPSGRRGLEIAVPSPAGVRGFYVLPLRGLPDICTPTLHDRLLVDLVERIPAVTPDAIIGATRQVAQEGFAGREAAAAASAAAKAQANQRLITNYRLLLLLIRQTEVQGEHVLPPERDVPLSVQRRAERAVARLAHDAGLSPSAVVTAMDGLTEAYLAVGFRGDPTRARYQGELVALADMAEEVARWGELAVDPQQSGCASLIARSARLTVEAGEILMERVLAATEDLRALLLRWTRDSEAVLRETARLAWLLDGWSVMAGLWRSADRMGRAATVGEMAVMVPSMPREVTRWTGEASGEVSDEPHSVTHSMRSRFVVRMTDWRTGRMLELTERNEVIVKECL
ncbi:hypothetical protein [Roseomonas indoligenes]|uniref:Uncharacterized protein n=1 Tax=Roseomonas indoligenes TaxID=2820811 RepID=A0A940MRY8_9PROT|nr:hypothetical protein [Pararoseomonas indoligenes]MBP0492948.1 hypothetical protein [Pararoseomonas indoligenes]